MWREFCTFWNVGVLSLKNRQWGQIAQWQYNISTVLVEWVFKCVSRNVCNVDICDFQQQNVHKKTLRIHNNLPVFPNTFVLDFVVQISSLAASKNADSEG